jgi:hypothetical protein
VEKDDGGHSTRGELGGLESEINSGIYSAPGGCRGFGLGGLGHPLMS